MPQRFLRPGITNSDGWNSVSFGAQSFYIRILTLVDDYGRYDGRLAILHAHCFALRADVTIKQTAGFRSELQESGLAILYVVEGKEFIQLSKWQERARGNSKYPDPATADVVNPQDSAGNGSGKTLPSPSPIAIVPSPPPTPQRGNGRGESKLPTSEPAKQIATLFHRKHTKPWGAKEIKAFKALTPIDGSELDLVCRYTESERKRGEDGIHRRDLVTFLNNFATEIDRAREWARRNPKSAKASTNGNHAPEVEPEGWRERMVKLYPQSDPSKKWADIPMDIRKLLTP